MFFAQLLPMLCLILLLSHVSCRSNPPPPPPPTTTGRISDKPRPGQPSPLAPGGPHV
ncbi:hypothetical protein MKW98_009956 [Papaver atlanticum]|uniref:Uncharacterized protein n=1 Tax=Papaver atlanticum TaxID=357466 RepID=A0AAD4T3E0_9MAGN|nr:hypothetical protein MKW98_009956 [Papaver atlanticum]